MRGLHRSNDPLRKSWASYSCFVFREWCYLRIKTSPIHVHSVRYVPVGDRSQYIAKVPILHSLPLYISYLWQFHSCWIRPVDTPPTEGSIVLPHLEDLKLFLKYPLGEHALFGALTLPNLRVLSLTESHIMRSPFLNTALRYLITRSNCPSTIFQCSLTILRGL